MSTESIQQRAAELRRRAEARLRAMEAQAGAPPPPDEAQRLLHELRVHKIELEMQNEELIRAQVELDGLRARYFDLYHLAPVGYLTLSEKGLILEANLRAGALLGLPPGTLVKRSLGRFIHSDDADVYYRCNRQLWRTGVPQACEVRLDPRREGAALIWARLELVLAQDAQEQATVCRAILNDVSERKWAEQALAEREERQRLVLDHLSAGVVFADIAGNAFYVNPTFTELFGYTLAQIPTLADWWPLAHPEPADREQVVAEWNRRLAEALAGRGEIRPMEVAITCSGGAQKHVRITARVIGEHLFVTFINLSERRAAEDTLRASEVRYRDLYENAPVAYFSVGTDGCIRRCNRQAAQMLGTTIEQTVGRPVFDLYPDNPHGKAKARQVFQHFLAGEPVINEELQMLRADGTPIWIDLSVTAIRDAAGQVVESRSAVLGISERKAAEEALAASEERYRLLTMLSPDGLSVADQTGRILACNAQFAAMYGFASSAEVVGRNAQELATPEAFAGLYREVAAALDRGESGVRGIEVEVLRRDGSSFPTEYSIAPVPWPDAPFGVAYLCSIRDITRRKEQAAELERHRLQLEELVAARTAELRAEIAERAAAQVALGRSEAGLAAAERVARMGSWEQDLRTGELRLSAGLCRMLGFAPEMDPHAAYAAARERVHPEDAARARTAIARAQAAGTPLDITFRITGPSDEMISFHMLAEFERDAAGRPVLMRATAQDRTEQAAAQTALQRSEAGLAAAERIAQMGSWEEDFGGGEIQWSAGMYRVFGLAPDMPPKMAQAASWEAIHPADVVAAKASFEQSVRKGGVNEYTCRILRPSGEVRVIRGIVEVTLDGAGRPWRLQGAVQDVTERVATQAALRESEAGLAAAQRMAHVGSWECDLRTGAYTFSAEMYRIFGLDPQAPELPADAFWNALHPNEHRPMDAAFKVVVETGATYDVIHRIVRPSGEPRMVRVLTELIRDVAGRPERVHGTVQDVTEQEQTRAALARQAEELTSLQDLGQFVSLALPLKEVIRVYLDRLLTMAGLDVAQVFLLRNGRLHLAGVRSTLAGPATQAEVLDVGECLCGQAVQQQQIMYAPEVECDLRCTNPHCHANGLHSLVALPLRSGEVVVGALAVGAVARDAFAERLIFLETAANLVAARLQNALLHQEVQARAAGLAETVTERTRELETERDRTQAILETVGESVIVTDLDGQMLFINPATTALTGRTREEELGNPLWHVWTPQARAEIWPQALAALRAGQAWHGEISGSRKNSALYIAGLTGTPLYDDAVPTLPVGAVWVQRDITQAKEAERLKDQFVSNVSHELRTPISIIELSCDSLEAYQGRLDDGQRSQIVQDIHEQAHLLSRLIEDILTVAQIDAGSIAPARNRVDLAELLRQETVRQGPVVAKRAQSLRVRAEASVTVLGHEGQLRQIVRNLLDNAIKYTPAGGAIHCSCEARPSAELASHDDTAAGAAWAVLEITDSGIGIAPKDMPFLFERFFRVNNESETPGTGLGLPIAQELVQLHGGWINVASTPGQGSTFTVYLQLAGEGTG